MFETVEEEKGKLVDKSYMLSTPGCSKPNIPRYLSAMKKQVNGLREHIKSFIDDEAIKRSLVHSNRYYDKIVYRNLLLLIKYGTATPNGTYGLTANVEKLGKVLRDRGVSIKPEEWNKLKD